MRRRLAVAISLLAVTVPLAAAPEREPDPELLERLEAAAAEIEGFDNRFRAEVWLTDMANRLASKVEDDQRRIELLETVHREARRAGLPPELVLAVIDVESDFQRYAISPSGARGLMQIMPFWLERIGRPDADLFDMQTNLRFGCTILRYYLVQSDGDLTEALARYNGSYGEAWYPRRVIDRLHERWYRQ